MPTWVLLIPRSPRVSMDGGVCASKRGCGEGRCSARDPMMGLWCVNVPGKPLPGLGPAVGLAPRGQSRPGTGWELLDRGHNRAAGSLPVPSGAVHVGQGGNAGRAGAAAGHGVGSGAPQGARAVVQWMVLWHSSCTSPGCPAVPGAVVPHARARPLREGGCHARYCLCSRNGRWIIPCHFGV